MLPDQIPYKGSIAVKFTAVLINNQPANLDINSLKVVLSLKNNLYGVDGFKISVRKIQYNSATGCGSLVVDYDDDNMPQGPIYLLLQANNINADGSLTKLNLPPLMLEMLAVDEANDVRLSTVNSSVEIIPTSADLSEELLQIFKSSIIIP